MSTNNPAKKNYLHESGRSLIELLIALTLGAIIIIAISGLLISAKVLQSEQIDASIMHDTAIFSLNNITRSVHQAGFTDYTSSASLLDKITTPPPPIIGLDAATLKATTSGIDAPIRAPGNTSDVLALRFSGLVQYGGADTVVNCAGFDVTATYEADEDANRGWSIYYVANDASGEPNLYCKYKGKGNGFTAQSIAKGVELFRVSYGLDTSKPANKIANIFLSASEINALDAGIPPAEFNEKTHWKAVTAVKVVLLIHGTANNSVGAGQTLPSPFGQSNPSSGDQRGVTGQDALKSIKYKTRLRQIYSATIQLKNSVT